MDWSWKSRPVDYFKLKSKTKLTTAPRPTTAAAMPRPTSRLLRTGLRETGAGAGRLTGAVVGAAVAPGGRLMVAPVPLGGRATGAATAGAGEPAVGGRGAAGAGVAPGGLIFKEEPVGEEGPLAGSVGSLIVGDELGLGGRLMRTVSFLG